jgi:hypothetical protein
MTTFIIVSLAIVVASYFIWRKIQDKHNHDPNYQVPATSAHRTDVLFGYFGCMRDQPQRTREYCNLFCEMFFDGIDKAIANIRYMETLTIVGLDYFVWEKIDGKYVIRADAQATVRSLFQRFRVEDVLQYIEIVSVCDEPDGKEISQEDMTLAVQLVRTVVQEFKPSIKMFCIYSTRYTWIAFDEFDLVAMDDYGAGNSYFSPTGGHKQIKERSSQSPRHPKLIVIPAPADPWRMLPTAWLNAVNNDTQIIAVLAFVWFTNHATDADYGKGVEENGLESIWREAAIELIGGARSVNKAST